MSPSALLFDLDGTLVDSHREISLALERAFLDMGMDLGFARVHALVDGSPLEDIWRAAHGHEAPEFDAFAAAYRTHYLRDLGQHCRLFPGVYETLAALRERLRGVPFGVVSNKSAPTVWPLLRAFGIEHCFELALGCGGTPIKPKPHPDSLISAAQQLGQSPRACVMIGDTVLDVRAGVAAGMTTVAMTYGMGDARALRESGAHHIFDTFEVLLTLFA